MTTETLNFQNAIDIITDDNVDWKALTIMVAKIDPSVLVEAYSRIAGNKDWLFWKREATRLFQVEGKVAAIKHCREMTGMGLKEAKEAVEKL